MLPVPCVTMTASLLSGGFLTSREIIPGPTKEVCLPRVLRAPFHILSFLPDTGMKEGESCTRIMWSVRDPLGP